jgi:hypothetical protein
MVHGSLEFALIKSKLFTTFQKRQVAAAHPTLSRKRGSAPFLKHVDCRQGMRMYKTSRLLHLLKKIKLIQRCDVCARSIPSEEEIAAAVYILYMLTCTAGILYTLSFAIPFNPGKLECYWAAAIWLQRRMKKNKKSKLKRKIN